MSHVEAVWVSQPTQLRDPDEGVAYPARGWRTRSVATGSFDLNATLRGLGHELGELWHRTPALLPSLGPPVSFWRHLGNARAATRLVDELAAGVSPAASERNSWRETARERLQRFGESRLQWPEGYRRLLLADDFLGASRAFAREARALVPDMPLAELGQALRNVWIGNSLQMLLRRPVALGPGLFAYSMLYPLTDNLLDDPHTSNEAKRSFNERFGCRLAGAPVTPRLPQEVVPFGLVESIEAEHPRALRPKVHESLLAIHAAQVQSLVQQGHGHLSDEEILGMTFEKGGCSLVADLYLVAGEPTLDEVRFAYGYGVFLQLIDDLQDLEVDQKAGHQTVMTRAASSGTLDGVVMRLLGFMDAVLDAPGPFSDPDLADVRDLISRNCRALVVSRVAEEPWRFSRRFRSAIARQWPLSLRALRRLRRRATRRARDAQRRLGQHGSGDSLLEWVLAEDGEGR